MAVARTKPAEAPQCVEDAGLIYTLDDRPGIRRVQAGKEFRFIDANGKTVRDEIVLARIKRLAIPPAWTNVWICPKADGHLQATGRDARGRKQYRYHPRWRETRDEAKFDRMLAFAKALPKIRAHVEADLKKPGLSREKVLAAVLKILETGLIRVGNDEYARTNKSFGLTTMRDRHASVNGSTINFEFRGKSGKFHKISIEDRRLAKIVAGCQAIPGQELFQYIDEGGQPRDITSSDVNAYLREITGADFTAKDFRTWGGTVLAAILLREMERVETKKQAKKNLLRAIEEVAQKLGNTPSICRKCYIHPVIMDSYLTGSIHTAGFQRSARSSSAESLERGEAMVVSLLRAGGMTKRRNERTTLVEKLQASIRHRTPRRRNKAVSGKR